MRYLLVLTALLTISLRPITVHACLWDHDTVQMEATGLPKVVHAIIGHFPRNPPLFFEMRLERNSKLIATDPQNLEAYDNCAVACDRLGRFDEAIEWMKKKKAILDTLDQNDATVKDHRYRYLANLGTHHIHRWLKNGRPADDLGDVDRSVELLTEAIALNPDAHFGREKFQLAIIEEIQKTYTSGAKSIRHSSIVNKVWDQTEGNKTDQILEALVGIITLGAGWESAFMYDALSDTLGYQDDNILAALAYFRAREIDAKQGITLRGFTGSEFGVDEERWVKLQDEYDLYRQQANQYQEQRLAFMTQKLMAGEHPDTHPDFFSGEGERFAPASFTSEEVMRSYVGHAPLINWKDPYLRLTLAGILFLLICFGIVFTFIMLIIILVKRVRSRKLEQLAATADAPSQ